MNLKEITKGGNYSFSEKIIQYMKIMSELMGKKHAQTYKIYSFRYNSSICHHMTQQIGRAHV